MKILDLYCGGGGAAKGYVLAGFEVLGVDTKKQKHYPFEYVMCNAIEFLNTVDLTQFAAVHTSPPCQAYSVASNVAKAAGKTYPDLVGPTRDALIASGLPYIIENVPGAPLNNPVVLCGTMFGLGTYRHRLFETNFPVTQPEHPKHVTKTARQGYAPKEGEFMSVTGNFPRIDLASKAMGINWMNRKSLSQAIPPAYTRYIGTYLMRRVR